MTTTSKATALFFTDSSSSETIARNSCDFCECTMKKVGLQSVHKQRNCLTNCLQPNPLNEMSDLLHTFPTGQRKHKPTVMTYQSNANMSSSVGYITHCLTVPKTPCTNTNLPSASGDMIFPEHSISPMFVSRSIIT